MPSHKTISIQSIIDLSLSERHFNSMWYTPKEEAQIWIALIFTCFSFVILIVRIFYDSYIMGHYFNEPSQTIQSQLL